MQEFEENASQVTQPAQAEKSIISTFMPSIMITVNSLINSDQRILLTQKQL